MTDSMQLVQRPPQYVVPGPQPRRCNVMAITAFVVVFFSSVAGLVLGYVALGQLERTHESGRGLALAAVILGWVGTLGFLLVAVLLFAASWVFKVF